MAVDGDTVEQGAGMGQGGLAEAFDQGVIGAEGGGGNGRDMQPQRQFILRLPGVWRQ